ncbi:MAG: helix-turn-helix transcriptional regulator [Actinobacteria bacterium]|nr:helix-turn-helix transcriptional regulator [Actinomycetota bacterium]
MDPRELVRSVRQRAGLSLRELAGAAGVATSTVHRIERGEMHPTVELLSDIVTAAGARLVVEPQPDPAASLVGLALTIRDDNLIESPVTVVRHAAELVSRFMTADRETRGRMIAADPPSTGDPRWDAFLAGVAEWLASQAGVPSPRWASRPKRFLSHGWWVSPRRSLRAWQFAGTPASLQKRGVYLHRESLVNV